MNDPFVGTWTLNPTRSVFDPNHKPRQGTMTLELDADGTYVLLAAGVDAKGNRCEEKPQRMRPDGVAYPIEGFPGLTSVTTRPNRHTLRAEARREDGSLVGEGSYVVADDGQTMTAIGKGIDSQLRPFTQQTAWDRQLTGEDEG